jgi:hypothetical protein
MGRVLKAWLPAFMDYTSGTEAPRLMHFWCGVSAIAGALRRKVWIDMKRFKWTPTFYIVFVAPPGIISKTTTMDLGMDLLKQVPGIKFGPDVVTWQALVGKFAEAQESFQYGEEWMPMSPLTLASGEFGNLINPSDKDMINFYITMWDGRSTFEKVTKMSGNDMIEAPWINMIGCTTPHWIADNMPSATVGGGFTSRCIFVYGEKKENFIAYPDEHVSADFEQRRADLIADLEHIAVNLVGEFRLPEETRAWGREWYQKIWSAESRKQDSDHLDGYMARKQTHMHKLAMVLSVSDSDDLVIHPRHLQLANVMLEEAEKDLDKVFSRIGRSEESLQAERFIEFIRRHGRISYVKAYQHIHSYFPDFRDFEGILAGAIRSGVVKMEFSGVPRMGHDGKMEQDAWLVYAGEIRE